jgi:3-hydroxybutyryl-CoA dehydratase
MGVKFATTCGFKNLHMRELGQHDGSGLRQGNKFTQQFVVSQYVYEGFIRIFNDQNPFHISDAVAHEHGFAGKIMHGNILNGFISYFVGECLPIKNVVIQSQEIKFHKPVYLGDKVTLCAEVADFHDSVRTAEIIFQFLNQNNVKVAKGKLFVGVL